MLLAGVNFMPEMHLRQPIFTYSPRILFTENKKMIQKNVNFNSFFPSIDKILISGARLSTRL